MLVNAYDVYKYFIKNSSAPTADDSLQLESFSVLVSKINSWWYQKQAL